MEFNLVGYSWGHNQDPSRNGHASLCVTVSVGHFHSGIRNIQVKRLIVDVEILLRFFVGNGELKRIFCVGQKLPVRDCSVVLSECPLGHIPGAFLESSLHLFRDQLERPFAHLLQTVLEITEFCGQREFRRLGITQLLQFLS